MFCPKCGNEINESDIFCSKCGHQINKESTKGDSNEELITNVETERTPQIQTSPTNNNNTWWGCLGCLGVIVLFILLISSCSLSSDSDSDPSYYDTGDPNDMTNKEMGDFLEWKDKQDQKEWENQQFDGQ